MSRSENNPFNVTSSDIFQALSSFISNSRGSLQSNLNFLSSQNANSSALDALRGYGATIQSPGWNECNTESASDGTSCKPFSSLNLKSVDEEDEFLYGDSNDVSEENTVKEDPVTSSIRKPKTEWSDDEDPYGESSVTALDRFDPRLTKNLSDCDSPRITHDTRKFYPTKREEDVIEENTPSTKISVAKHLPQKSNIILSSQTERSQFPVSETSSSLLKTKSSFHAAAEVLKKRTFENTKLISNSSNEKLGPYPGTSKYNSEFEYKPAHSDLKIDNLEPKQTLRTINKKHKDNIRDYITGPERKRSHPHEEFGPEKHLRYDNARSISPSRHHSPHNPSLASYRSSHVSSESDNLKYKLSYSRNRSPGFEYEKRPTRYQESHRQYSPSPKGWSHEKSPDYKYRNSRSRRTRSRSPRPQRTRSRSPRPRRTRSRSPRPQRTRSRSPRPHRTRSRSPRSQRTRSRSPRSRRSRSPNARRSKSKSPGYYSSKSKILDKKMLLKSGKISDFYSRKKGKSKKYNSPDSFCSLSLGSSSRSSSPTSEESSDKSKISKKALVKATPIDNKMPVKPGNAVLSDDISKKLSDIFNVKDNNDLFNSSNIHDLVNALQPSDTNQQLIEFLEGLQQQQPPIAASTPTVSDINVAPNLQMPVTPTSEPYVYPTVPAAPVCNQYATPQMLNFPQMVQPTAFPAPVMTSVQPTQYGPYLPVPSTDSQYITNFAPKSGKVRPATLRTIPVSDSLPGTSSSGLNINVFPNNSSLQKASAKSSQELMKPKPQESKSSLEKNIKKIKEKVDKNVELSSKDNPESISEHDKYFTIEKFKKMKADRNLAMYKLKTASDDIDEMHKLLEETFGKKISLSEKLIYTRCKNLYNIALDTHSNYNKDARRIDEELSKFKAKLPASLQAEISKIKVELPKDEHMTDEIYSGLDQGDHHCYDCNMQFNSIKTYLTHIQTTEHKESMEAKNNKWKKDFIKEENQEPNPLKKSVLKAVKGVDFVKPLTGFYCSLCREVVLDEATTEQHVKSHKHYTNYLIFIKKNPLYERKILFKRYILISLPKQKKSLPNPEVEIQKKLEEVKKEIEIKKQKQLEWKKNQEAAEKKSKEIILNEKRKEIKVEELVEEKCEDLPPSSSQQTANIKLNLSEKEKGKSVEKQKPSKESETKNPTKFIYIGKAPNFKKSLSQKPIPWYQRESILNKTESDTDPSSDANGKAAKCLPPKVKGPSSTKKPETPNSYSDNKLKLQKMFKDIDEKKQQQEELKKNQEAVEKKSKEILLDENTKNSGNSVSVSNKPSKNSVSVSNKPSKNSVSVSNKPSKNAMVSKSSNYKLIPLSEIDLPEVSSLPSTNNANVPQPMDIDNSQDVPTKPKSEEEKDFLLLGINKEDFKPLAVPVPPPTSMVSYPTLYNAPTSNVSCGNTSTPTVSQHAIKSIDFSVPPPTIPSYQNNVPTVSVYGNQNTQNIGPYSYPINNQQMSHYSNPTQMSLQTDFQTMAQFSTPPPDFRNPPPMHPYSNTGNMPPASQFSSPNNLPYNAMPPDQSYQPPVYPIPPNNQTHYLVANNASQGLAPPGSACDTSFMNYNTNFPPSNYVNPIKTSPTTKTVGNLIAILPEKKALQFNKPISGNKYTKVEEKTSKSYVQQNRKLPPTNNVAIKIIKNDAVSQIKKSSNAASVDEKMLKTSKIVKSVEKSSNNTLDGNGKVDKCSLENEVKHIIDQCTKKLELKELKISDIRNNVKSSLTVETPAILNNSTNSNNEFKKSEQMPVDEISNGSDRAQNAEVVYDRVSDMSSKNSCSSTNSSNKIDELTTNNRENTEVTVAVKAKETITEGIIHDNETTLVLSTENVTNTEGDSSSHDNASSTDSSPDKDKTSKLKYGTRRSARIQKKNKCNDEKSDILEEKDIAPKKVDVAPMTINDTIDSGNHEISNVMENEKNKNDIKETTVESDEKQIPVQNMEVVSDLEKTSNSSSADNSNKIEKVTEDKKSTTVTIKANETIKESSIHDSKAALMQSNINSTNDSVLSKHEQIIAKNASELSCDETSKANHEKDYDEPMEIGDNALSEKSSIESFPVENSTKKDLDMSNVNTIIEEEKINGDSCCKKNVQNENIKDCFVKLAVDTVLEKKSSLQNIDATHMSVIDTVDPKSHNIIDSADALIDKDAASEINTLKSGKRRSARIQKNVELEENKKPVQNIDVIPTSVSESLDSSGHDCANSSDASIDKDEASENTKQCGKRRSKRIQKKTVKVTKSSGQASKDVDKNDLESDTTSEINDVLEAKSSLSSSQDAVKDDQISVVKEEKSEKVVILVEKMEPTEASSCDQVTQGVASSKVVLQRAHSELDKGCEDSKILEDDTEASIKSGLDLETAENKQKASNESATEEKESVETSTTEEKEEPVETSKKSADSKHSSDTEDYSDDV